MDGRQVRDAIDGRVVRENAEGEPGGVGDVLCDLCVFELSFLAFSERFLFAGCGHCRQMKPQYSDAAKELAAEGHKNVIAMIECNKNPHVADEYEIQGFPTLKLFANGVYVKDYTGKREKNEIKAFLKEALGSAKKKDEL